MAMGNIRNKCQHEMLGKMPTKNTRKNINMKNQEEESAGNTGKNVGAKRRHETPGRSIGGKCQEEAPMGNPGKNAMVDNGVDGMMLEGSFSHRHHLRDASNRWSYRSPRFHNHELEKGVDLDQEPTVPPCEFILMYKISKIFILVDGDERIKILRWKLTPQIPLLPSAQLPPFSPGFTMLSFGCRQMRLPLWLSFSYLAEMDKWQILDIHGETGESRGGGESSGDRKKVRTNAMNAIRHINTRKLKIIVFVNLIEEFKQAIPKRTRTP